MATLQHNVVEKEIIKAVDEIKRKLKIDAVIDSDCRPGEIAGIGSQILVTVIGRLASKLGVTIPNGCYIFNDPKTQKKLSVKEATQKLILATQTK